MELIKYYSGLAYTHKVNRHNHQSAGCNQFQWRAASYNHFDRMLRQLNKTKSSQFIRFHQRTQLVWIFQMNTFFLVSLFLCFVQRIRRWNFFTCILHFFYHPSFFSSLNRMHFLYFCLFSIFFVFVLRKTTTNPCKLKKQCLIIF